MLPVPSAYPSGRLLTLCVFQSGLGLSLSLGLDLVVGYTWGRISWNLVFKWYLRSGKVCCYTFAEQHCDARVNHLDGTLVPTTATQEHVNPSTVRVSPLNY